MFLKIASWNVNSIHARLDHVTAWLTQHEPDVLLLQELKGAEFPDEVFKKLGYESVAVTQKAYNGVAVMSRLPIETINKVLAEKIPGLSVHIGQSGQECRLLLLVVPFRENQVDELVHPRGLCARGVSLRNNDLADGGDCGVLVWVQRLQDGLRGQLIMHRLKE